MRDQNHTSLAQTTDFLRAAVRLGGEFVGVLAVLRRHTPGIMHQHYARGHSRHTLRQKARIISDNSQQSAGTILRGDRLKGPAVALGCVVLHDVATVNSTSRCRSKESSLDMLRFC